MLYVVTIMLCLSNLFGIFNSITLLKVNEYCDDVTSVKTKAYTISNVVMECLMDIFFNVGVWMLIYKYWEVSFIVPL